MKLRTMVKIAVTSSVVLLCSGFALYSFFKISAAENQKDFNLYILLPPTAMTVLATDDAQRLVSEIDDLTCSKNGQFLRVSKLLAFLKRSLYTLSEGTPHRLSRQMNQVLISFHEPADGRNEVFYCKLGSGDRDLIGRFLQTYLSSPYLPKTSTYQGEEITIYPLSDGDFLACYLTVDFLALSFQKNLLEEVIDARKKRKSLADEPAFAEARLPRKSVATATFYTRVPKTEGWAELDMTMKEDYIYLSGRMHDTDSCSDFVGQLHRQYPVKGFPDRMLPASVSCFSRQEVADWKQYLNYTKPLQPDSALGEVTAPYVINTELASYLNDYAGRDLLTCLFPRSNVQREDSLQQLTAVLSIIASDVPGAERQLRTLMNTLPGLYKERIPRIRLLYTTVRSYPVYTLPSATLFTQVPGFVDLVAPVSAVFYNDRLLLAPDVESLSDYITQLDKGEELDRAEEYKAILNSMSESYQLMIAGDFDRLYHGMEGRSVWMPDFFLRHTGFFRHFVFLAQLTAADEMLYPNIVLKYKSE